MNDVARFLKRGPYRKAEGFFVPLVVFIRNFVRWLADAVKQMSWNDKRIRRALDSLGFAIGFSGKCTAIANMGGPGARCFRDANRPLMVTDDGWIEPTELSTAEQRAIRKQFKDEHSTPASQGTNNLERHAATA